MMEQNTPPLNEAQTAKFLGVSCETLRGWRKRGRGPKCIKVGGYLVRYRLSDVIGWLEKQPTRGEA